MKKLLLALGVALGTYYVNAQQVNHTVTMGAGYANNAYYKIATSLQTNYPNNNWDISFFRQNPRDMGIRTNAAKGIQVFEASNNILDWNTVDVNNQTNWLELFNSDINLKDGSLQQGSATYGWGEYQMATHKVVGTIVFVFKYADGTYKKFKVNEFFGGYTFTYANWDGTNWGADVTATVNNATNPDNVFNYFNLQTGTEVVAEPISNNWDFIFTKYTTPLNAGGSTVNYLVTGNLLNPNIQVAKTTNATPNTYSVNANTIGYDWKTYTGGSYVVDNATNYFVKYPSGTIYKLNFTEFVSSTGVIRFTTEDVTANLGFESVDKISFAVYPNPSTDKKVNIVYDVLDSNLNQANLAVFSLNGAKVFEQKLEQNTGFYSSQIDLNKLSSGIYILKVDAGTSSISKKIVLK